MKILLTNHHLVDVGGSERWVETMSNALTELGHEVEVFTLNHGRFEQNIKVPIVKDFKDKYDLILANHTSTINEICLAHKPKCPIIQTCHSYFIEIEAPSPKATKHVAVSQEIADKYHIDTVINNPIDTSKFNFVPCNSYLKTILYLSHPWNKKALPIIREATYGYKLITIETQRDDIPDLIKQSDLVITLGRGIIESLACGKSVISADWRMGWMDGLKGAGLITDLNYEELKKSNFSGRPNQVEFNAVSLNNEIRKHSPFVDLSSRVSRDMGSKVIAQKYLDLWTSIKKDI